MGLDRTERCETLPWLSIQDEDPRRKPPVSPCVMRRQIGNPSMDMIGGGAIGRLRDAVPNLLWDGGVGRGVIGRDLHTRKPTVYGAL